MVREQPDALISLQYDLHETPLGIFDIASSRI